MNERKVTATAGSPFFHTSVSPQISLVAQQSAILKKIAVIQHQLDALEPILNKQQRAFERCYQEYYCLHRQMERQLETNTNLTTELQYLYEIDQKKCDAESSLAVSRAIRETLLNDQTQQWKQFSAIERLTELMVETQVTDTSPVSIASPPS